MVLIYLETEQYTEVPRRPVIEGVNQICTFVHSLPQGLCVWLPNVNSQLWLFITVFVLEEKQSKGKQVINSAILSIHVTSNKKNNIFLRIPPKLFEHQTYLKRITVVVSIPGTLTGPKVS